MQRRQDNQQGRRGGYDNYENRGGGGYQRRDPQGRGGKGGGQQVQRNRGEREKLMFGIVIAMKEMFGFLQPLMSIPGAEEHLYFNAKDMYGDRIQEGDEVQFCVKNGPRGYVAASVRRLDEGVKVKTSKAMGIVEKEADQYKFSPGLISLKNASSEGESDQAMTSSSTVSQQIPFMPADVNKSSRRVMKGDEVEFDVYVIPDIGYCRGHSIRVVRSRNDRLIAEQIKELEAQGAGREQGVIETIKNDFGFVRPVDRQDHIFFRLEDVLDSKEHLPNEGDEVDFFIINETVKGRVSDRAVHLKYLPHGTVQFEETLGTALAAVVTVEPRLYPREEPGQLQLCNSLQISTTNDTDPQEVETVELWSRCLPEGLTHMKCGDVLEIDVTKYRPEKLIFARNAKVKSYRALGRVYGYICDIKPTGGYGFIRSVQGDPDSYFRVAEVLGDDGLLIPDMRIKHGLQVSYEIIQEFGRGGNTKIRAVRVQACADSNFQPRKAILQKNVQGTILRESKKGDRDGVGTLQVTDELVDTSGIACHDVFVSQQDLFHALQDFRDNKHLKEVVVDHFMPYQRYALHALLRHHFTGIAHETIERENSFNSRASSSSLEPESGVQVLSLTESNLNAVTNSVATASAAVSSSITQENDSPTKVRGKKDVDFDKDRGQEVRIWKIEDPAEYEKWSKENSSHFENSNRSSKEGKKNVVHFQKSDLVDSLGIVRAGSDVTFDVCIDRVTGARVAANVQVSDLQADDGQWPQLGCLEYLRVSPGGDEHGGYIRCVSSNEKLMWNQLIKSTENENEGNTGVDGVWNTGSIVSFEIRLRGGVRYAAGVALLSSDSELVSKEERLLEGAVIGVVVNSPGDDLVQSVYVVDASNCPEMKNKIVDMPSGVNAVKSKKHGASTNGPSDSAVWEKKKQDDDSDKEREGVIEKSDEVPDENVGKETTTSSPKKKEKKQSPSMHLYPSLPAVIVPLRVVEDSIPSEISSPLPVGTMVQCNLVANWFQQRVPLYALNAKVLPDQLRVENNVEAKKSLADMAVANEEALSVGRVKGTIIRLKINTQLGFDVSEISLSDQYRGDAGADDNLYYCDSRELRGSGKDKASYAAHVGDVVDFIPVAKYCVAACPVVAKASSRLGSNVPAPSAARRNVFNSSLQGGGSAGVKSITMAEGPQGDSIGFEPGWRGEVDVAALPWGHLLGHLFVNSQDESPKENLEDVVNEDVVDEVH